MFLFFFLGGGGRGGLDYFLLQLLSEVCFLLGCLHSLKPASS